MLLILIIGCKKEVKIETKELGINDCPFVSIPSNIEADYSEYIYLDGSKEDTSDLFLKFKVLKEISFDKEWILDPSLISYFSHCMYDKTYQNYLCSKFPIVKNQEKKYVRIIVSINNIKLNEERTKTIENTLRKFGIVNLKIENVLCE